MSDTRVPTCARAKIPSDDRQGWGLAGENSVGEESPDGGHGVDWCR